MLHTPRYHMISHTELQQRMVDSARNIFNVMADIALEECHEGVDDQQENWVTALVGFEGAFSGLVALHCPEPLARMIAAGLLCVDNDMETQDVHDAMGEVVNIIGGDMKMFLDSDGRQIRMSIPSVFEGDMAFQDEFLKVPDAVTCRMVTGDQRLLLGVQVSRGR